MLRLEIDDVLKKIKGAKKIGLQLPDGLKFKSDEIAKIFEKEGFEVFVSGESCYGACDIDLELLNEVDYLLHFCHTPIAEIDRVIYVPCLYDFEFDAEEIAKLIKIKKKEIALISTAQYALKLEELKDFLEKVGYKVELKKGSKRVKLKGQVLGCNYTALKNTNADVVLFVGDGLFHAIGASIYTGKKVYAYSPLTKEFRAVKSDEFIRRRYLRISKVLDKNKAAIIVSTKIGQERLTLALKLKKLAEEKGKDVDIILLNDVTPQKLDNFPYEYYINTACPRITYDDIELFKKPILTPQEFEIVLGFRDWENYEIDEIP
ncbi:diphthamide biosynthesis enzyme Dph2 [Archaeoglobales archaeon]|nr:MAG: diphthamide biosynthesis enzyme Dph2 [Archaeoglobales archaeon]